jgi:oxidase EvaA
LARSAAALETPLNSPERFAAWFEERREHQRQQVYRIALDELGGWVFESGTGDLRHASGRFFTIHGLHVRTDSGPVREWSQPIIDQPEIGILGILVKDFDGVPHFLMQAKTEPGNWNDLQLSPTVQATRSNYRQVHGGRSVPYVDRFRSPPPGRVLADVLQSEQGSWFHHKRNRNMIVEVTDDIEIGEGFCWLTLRQIQHLLTVDNLVNMDSRTVLSCLPDADADPDAAAADSRHPMPEIMSWITENQARHEVVTERVPLAEVAGWHRSRYEIAHDDGLFFSVVAVDVQATGREVTRWSQPLLQPQGVGVVAFLARRFDGVPHVLMNARVEPGYLDVVELAPTVQCVPENYRWLPGYRPPLLDRVLRAAPQQVRFDAVLSEEGGRFMHALNRYLVVEDDDLDPDRNLPAEVRDDYRWLTMAQLRLLLGHSHYVNVQARTMVACLRGTW